MRASVVCCARKTQDKSACEVASEGRCYGIVLSGLERTVTINIWSAGVGDVVVLLGRRILDEEVGVPERGQESILFSISFVAGLWENSSCSSYL